MGTWHDQWWRIRHAVTAGRVAGIVSVLVLAVGGYQLTQVDWAIYDNHAELPDDPEVIDTSLVTLRSVRLGDFDALQETPSFTWSQFVDVRIEADCVPGRFQIADPSRRWGEPRKNPELLRCSLGLSIVRRSSLGDGRVEVYGVLSGASVNRDNEMSWSGKTWIPHIRGEYRVCVVLHRTHRRISEHVRHSYEPIVIGTFDLQVTPGEPAK